MDNETPHQEVNQAIDPKREEQLRNDCSTRFYEFRNHFNQAIMAYSAYESAQARLSLHLVKKKQSEQQPDLFTQNNNENGNV